MYSTAGTVNSMLLKPTESLGDEGQNPASAKRAGQQVTLSLPLGYIGPLSK